MLNTILDQVEKIIENPALLFMLFFTFALINLFFPPIPLETATLFAGYLTGTGKGSLLVVIGATVSGMFISSLLLYQLLKKYGVNIIQKTPLRKAIDSDSYRKTLLWFKKYGWWTIFLAKIVPGMSLYTTICGGLLQLETAKAAPAFFLSNLFFFLVLALTGKFLGKKWGDALPWLTRLGVAAMGITAIFTAVVIILFLIRSFRVKN